MHKRTIVIIGIGIVAASIALYATQRLPADRHVAAEVLGVEPDALVTSGIVDVKQRPWGEQRTRLWRLPDEDAGSDTAGFAAGAEVDLDLEVALMAHWHTPARWGAVHEDAKFTRQQCIAAARAFAAEHCPYFEGGEPEEAQQYKKNRRLCYLVKWKGSGPGERLHRIAATISAVSGKITFYSLTIFPRAPKATMPVKITPEQAEEIVRKNLPKDVIPNSIEAYSISTNSPHGRRGEPVYYVDVQGHLNRGPSPKHRYGYGMVHEVHAATGQFLTRKGKEPRRPIGYQTRYIEKLHSEDARDKIQLTGEEAKEVLKDNLREDMKNPKIDIRELTDRSHFAPEGEPVYVAQIEFDVTKPDGEKVRGEVVWGVHAQTGELIRSAGY